MNFPQVDGVLQTFVHFDEGCFQNPAVKSTKGHICFYIDMKTEAGGPWHRNQFIPDLQTWINSWVSLNQTKVTEIKEIIQLKLKSAEIIVCL